MSFGRFFLGTGRAIALVHPRYGQTVVARSLRSPRSSHARSRSLIFKSGGRQNAIAPYACPIHPLPPQGGIPPATPREESACTSAKKLLCCTLTLHASRPPPKGAPLVPPPTPDAIIISPRQHHLSAIATPGPTHQPGACRGPTATLSPPKPPPVN